MAPRRKATRIEAPATLEEAISLIGTYLYLNATIDDVKAAKDEALRAIELASAERVAPAEAQMKDIFLQLRTWWAVARDDLTEGKRKSIELAGAIIGDRTSPPALKLPKGWKAEDAVAFMASIAETWPSAADLLRVKSDLEKPAIIKLLGSATAVGPLRDRIVEEGFTTAQKEEFFIARAVEKDPDPVVEQPVEEVLS